MCSESWYVSGKEIMYEGDFNLEFQALRNAAEKRHTWNTWLHGHRM
jgi:hypothetical protein